MGFAVSSRLGLERAVLALVLAYALALQAVTGAMASGAGASAIVNAAEHSLCAPEPQDGSSDSGGPNQHAGLCILSCGLVPVGVESVAPTVLGADAIWVEHLVIVCSQPLTTLDAPRPFHARAPPSVLA